LSTAASAHGARVGAARVDGGNAWHEEAPFGVLRAQVRKAPHDMPTGRPSESPPPAIDPCRKCNKPMLDRLDAMLAFVAVCDAAGFAPAARRLGVSPSVVTRRVAALEQRLGTRLLQRTTRSVRLTEVGARFLERARHILAQVEETEAAATDERSAPRGRLVVAAPVLFGRMHVEPLLATYLAQYPQAQAELRLSDGFVSLVEEGIDVAIRIGRLADSSLVARALGETRRVLVAAPGYLARRGGAPREPGALARHELIGFRPLTGQGAWTFRDADRTEVQVAVSPRFTTNNGDVAISRAAAGGGITAAYCYQVDALLRSGALVEILAAFAPDPIPIQAVFPTSRLLSAKVRAFLELAAGAAAGWPFLRRRPPEARGRSAVRRRR
jgi:DNA-binding transcriptional LysR family regulator